MAHTLDSNCLVQVAVPFSFNVHPGAAFNVNPSPAVAVTVTT